MLPTLHAAQDLLGTIAIMGLLSVVFGMAKRVCTRPWLSNTVLGSLFGLTSLLAMLDPVPVAPGVIVDLRNVPVVLAAAFLRIDGAAAATVLAVLGRIALGGTGMAAGVAGLLLAALAGLAWRGLQGRRTGQGGPGLLPLAAGSCLALLPGLALPPEVVGRFLEVVLAVVAPLQVLGVLVVGHLLQRECCLIEGERRLAQVAQHDSLTGVLNRRGFEAAMILVEPQYAGAALLLIDLDHFKSVNDRHGHAAGDAVLGAIERRLGPALRPGDLLGRLGGEEFAVYLPLIAPAGAERVAARLCEALRAAPFELPGGTRLKVTGSIGGAWADGPIGLERLLPRADAALYAAKAQGRDRHVMAPIPGLNRRAEDLDADVAARASAKHRASLPDQPSALAHSKNARANLLTPLSRR